MSKFHELSVLATKYSRAFFDHKSKCERMAGAVMRDYAKYLGCPEKNVEFLQLDGNLRPTGQVVPFSGTVPVVRDGEGYWHFCAQIRLDGADENAYSHDRLKMSLNLQGNVLSIREDREFRADATDLATLGPLFDYLYESSRADYENPTSSTSKRIGFVV